VGYVKNYVYTPVDDTATLRTRIIEEMRSVAKGIWATTSSHLRSTKVLQLFVTDNLQKPAYISICSGS